MTDLEAPVKSMPFTEHPFKGTSGVEALPANNPYIKVDTVKNIVTWDNPNLGNTLTGTKSAPITEHTPVNFSIGPHVSEGSLSSRLNLAESEVARQVTSEVGNLLNGLDQGIDIELKSPTIKKGDPNPQPTDLAVPEFAKSVVATVLERHTDTQAFQLGTDSRHIVRSFVREDGGQKRTLVVDKKRVVDNEAGDFHTETKVRWLPSESVKIWRQNYMQDGPSAVSIK